jgi:hypothetical protein
MSNRKSIITTFTIIFLVGLLIFITGCTSGIIDNGQNAAAQKEPDVKPIILETTLPTLAVTVEPTQQVEIPFWISPAIPEELKNKVQLNLSIKEVTTEKSADLSLIPISEKKLENVAKTTDWVFALVSPFPTITDNVTVEELEKAWHGEKIKAFSGNPLLISETTLQAFATNWGKPSEKGVKVIAEDELLQEAWKIQPAWAIVPFEKLEPRWKVLSVDGLSPLDKTVDVKKYPLTIQFGFSGKQEILSKILENPGGLVILPTTNRDPEKMTTLVMTGTTALARGTAERMETMGIDYPAEKIRSWLKDADLTHISNEIPFSKKCPAAVPVRNDWNFCSDPKYIELLKYIGADIIELTGNHVMDWGASDFLFTLGMYKENHFLTYGGGQNVKDAQKALLVEDHGNKLAFLGCTPPGPAYAWATDVTPGNAPCDRDWMASEVKRLTALGYQVIVTYQHIEVYDYAPVPPQRGDFQRMAEAGAVIVSGSQSHFPQGMGFYKDQFLHYGLGNLFFDQMDEPVVGTRREFIDRHIFYDGRYISTELLTAMLEDHAQPRPMTSAERQALLRDAFKVSTW